MKISADEVSHVAKLARLNLSAEEVDTMAGQLDRILSYVAKLDELDTQGIEPTTHVLSLHNAFREDQVSESLPQETALANAPQQNGEAFIVPRVI